MKVFAQEKTRKIIQACLNIVLGILILMFPQIGSYVFTTIFGCMFVTVGGFFLLAYFCLPLIHDPRLFLESMMFILTGALIFTFPDLFLSVIDIMAAVYLVFEGVSHFSYSLGLKSLGDKKWWIDLIYSICVFGLGIFLIVFIALQLDPAYVNAYLGGGFLIFDSLFDLILIFCLHRSYKQIINPTK